MKNIMNYKERLIDVCKNSNGNKQRLLNELLMQICIDMQGVMISNKINSIPLSDSGIELRRENGHFYEIESGKCITSVSELMEKYGKLETEEGIEKILKDLNKYL